MRGMGVQQSHRRRAVWWGRSTVKAKTASRTHRLLLSHLLLLSSLLSAIVRVCGVMDSHLFPSYLESTTHTRFLCVCAASTPSSVCLSLTWQPWSVDSERKDQEEDPFQSTEVEIGPMSIPASRAVDPHTRTHSAHLHPSLQPLPPNAPAAPRHAPFHSTSV